MVRVLDRPDFEVPGSHNTRGEPEMSNKGPRGMAGRASGGTNLEIGLAH